MSSFKPSTTPCAVLLGTCRDQKGLVAKISKFIYENGGNIVDSAQHTDHEVGIFCVRMEWILDGFNIPREAIASEFSKLASSIGMTWNIRFTDEKQKCAIFVSKQDHCLIDLLGRQRCGDLIVDIPIIISNHESLRPIAQQFGICFQYLPIDKENKPEQEKREIELLRQHNVDLVILAKYMQVLSPDLLIKLPHAINIHHSFLPAFPGANPYHRAFARGVKIIGATAHYVTEDLDEGPIIEQGVRRVSHRDTVQDMIRKGKDIEKYVLARAVYLHLNHRILVYGNKTVVFD
ncbi:MAG: formyltetrahydrofolate deformylase [Oligoflexales bacterium]|nr:formyltetrahydrofolate deformylase [Oligoflexales bacterium]